MDAHASTIVAWLPAAILVMVRLGSVGLVAPILSGPAVPVRVRILLSVLLGAAVLPVLASRGIAEACPLLHLDFAAFLPLVVMEVAFGAMIGFLATLPLVAAQSGGVLMGQQMGLGFAQMFNPSIDDESDLMGQLFFLIALATFLMIGGLEHMMLAVLHSFDYVPLGGFTVDGNLAGMLSGMLLAAFELTLRIAAPLLSLIFLETVAMTFLARSVPQVNILSLGFPVRILAGLAILIAGLGITHGVLIEGTGTMLDAIHQWATTPP